MRLIKTRPRYHCDFCSHTSTKAAMEAHEPICWKNPNRHCSSCNDTGYCPGRYEEDAHAWTAREPCYYCSKVTPDSDAADLLKPRMPSLIRQLAEQLEAAG